MSFQEVGLSWDGKEYVVPADQVMGLVNAVEEIITLEELYGVGIKRMKLSQAYAAALRYAGAGVNAEQIYSAMFGPDAGVTTRAAVSGILALMIPPEHITTALSQGKKTQGRKKKTGG